MPYTVTKFPHGVFSWTDVASTDIAKTKTFLTSLFGWTAEDMPTGKSMPDYTMFKLDGHYVAGGSATFAPDMPSYWTSYINVDDVDTVVSLVQEQGGKVTVPAMDVFESGRMAVIQDPTGAHVGLWQPKNHIGAGIVNTVGAMCWNELYTPDLAKAKAFYYNVFHWDYDMDDISGYATIKNNGRMNGGMMQITEEMQGMVPCWITYFTVLNLDASIARVKELGGMVHMTRDIDPGKIAMISDPAGAHCILMEMHVTPEEWVE